MRSFLLALLLVVGSGCGLVGPPPAKQNAGSKCAQAGGHCYSLMHGLVCSGPVVDVSCDSNGSPYPVPGLSCCMGAAVMPDGGSTSSSGGRADGGSVSSQR